MGESSIDDEREALNRRREEITLLLRSLPAQDGSVDQPSREARRIAQLNQIKELDRRLAEIALDEEGSSRMEGGE